MDYYKKKFSPLMITKLKEDKAIINGSLGGLLLGPSHEENGIYFLVKYGDIYVLEGEVEGYEYVITSNRDLSSLNSINNQSRDSNFNFSGNEDLSKITIIDTTTPNKMKYKSKYVLFDRLGFSIINKNSTKRFLNELEKMNNGLQSPSFGVE